MKSFLDDTDQLAKWLDTVETEIEKFEEISIYPDELIEQSEELAVSLSTHKTSREYLHVSRNYFLVLKTKCVQI